jgi:hypothetical protein
LPRDSRCCSALYADCTTVQWTRAYSRRSLLPGTSSLDSIQTHQKKNGSRRPSRHQDHQQDNGDRTAAVIPLHQQPDSSSTLHLRRRSPPLAKEHFQNLSTVVRPKYLLYLAFPGRPQPSAPLNDPATNSHASWALPSSSQLATSSSAAACFTHAWGTCRTIDCTTTMARSG